MGPAFRVPLIIASPWVRAGTVFKGALDHTSIPQFVEHTFSTRGNSLELPPINARRRTLADLRGAFNFAQPAPQPALPTPRQLFAWANQTVPTLDASRTVVDCGATVPRAGCLPSWESDLQHDRAGMRFGKSSRGVSTAGR